MPRRNISPLQGRSITTSAILRSTDDRNSKPNSQRPSESRSDEDPEGQSSPANRTSGDFKDQTDKNASTDPYAAFSNYPPVLRELAMRSLAKKLPPSSTSKQHSPGNQVENTNSVHDPSTPAQSSLSPSSPLSASSNTAYRRPTKEDLLRYARGFWTRFRIRFKWFTIRGFRRFNADDFSAFFTLGGLGTIVLIVVGTTTAFSIVLWGLDMLNMQSEYHACRNKHSLRATHLT